VISGDRTEKTCALVRQAAREGGKKVDAREGAIDFSKAKGSGGFSIPRRRKREGSTKWRDSSRRKEEKVRGFRRPRVKKKKRISRRKVCREDWGKKTIPRGKLV